MKKSFNKRAVFIVILTIVLVAMVGSFVATRKDRKIKSYEKLYTQVVIDATLKGEDSSKKETIDMFDDGKNAEANASFMSRPIYMTKRDMLYEENGRYKRIKSDYSIRNIYSILSKIDVENEDGNYRPTVKKEVIDEILKSLFIDYECDEDAIANVEIEDERIGEFSIYLRDFNGYDKFSIVFVFENLSDQYEVSVPVFYDNLIDEVDHKKLKFID